MKEPQSKGIFEQIMDMTRLTNMMKSHDIIKDIEPQNNLVKKLSGKITKLKKEILK